MRIPFHFVLLPTGSIGHLVQDYEKILFEIEKLQKQDKFSVLYMRGSEVSNQYFLNQLEKRHRFVSRIPFVYLHRILLRICSTYRTRDLQIDSKSDSILSLIHANQTPFFISERDKAFDKALSELLSSFNLKKYVCLVARDLGYDNFKARSKNELQKQAMRQTPLDSFIPTINFLNELGYLVVRLGRHNESRLEVQRNGFAYAEIDNLDCSSSSVADFQVVEGSSFLISTGSGMDCLGLFYRKLTLYVNLLSAAAHPDTQLCPIGLLPTYYDQNRNIKLTFSEVTTDPIIRAGTAKLLDLNISVEPKGANEILNAVKLFVDIYEGRKFYGNKQLLY